MNKEIIFRLSLAWVLLNIIFIVAVPMSYPVWMVEQINFWKPVFLILLNIGVAIIVACIVLMERDLKNE